MKQARQFTHQRLVAYQRGLEMATLTHEICEGLPRGFADLKNQLLRSGCAVTLLIAEGAGRTTSAQKRQRFIEAQGECGEAAATVELFTALGAVLPHTNRRYQEIANHTSALLAGLIKRHS